MALKFKRPKTKGQLKRHIAEVKERSKICPKCGYKGLFIKNGYMIKKTLPVHYQKIKKYKCPNCGFSAYEDTRKQEEEYCNSVLRLVLHLYVEGVSKREILRLLKENGLKIGVRLVTSYIGMWDYEISNWINNNIKTKQAKTAKDYVRRESYIYSLLIQDRNDLTLLNLVNGNVQRGNLLSKQDTITEYGIDVLYRIAFHLHIEGMTWEPINKCLLSKKITYSHEKSEKLCAFIKYLANYEFSFINRAKHKRGTSRLVDYKRNVGYTYSLLILERDKEIKYEVVKGKMKNPNRKQYNPRLDTPPPRKMLLQNLFVKKH